MDFIVHLVPLIILTLMVLAQHTEPAQGNTSGHMQLGYMKTTHMILQTPVHALVVEYLLLILWALTSYYCESGLNTAPWNPAVLYSDDPLWDGQDCGGLESTCCDPPNLPWFCKELPQLTTDYLEFRICGDENISNEDTPVDLVQLYIQ